MGLRNFQIGSAAGVIAFCTAALVATTTPAFAQTSGDAAAGGFAVLVMFCLWTAMYFLPTIVAIMRKHNVASILLLNLFLGWTVIGWIIALVMAFGQQHQQTTTIINQVHAPINPTYAPQPQPPAQPPPAT